jgi:alpha-beta hydrolase superfamily lysophospholipase
MQKTKTKSFRLYLKWILWVLLVQFILANISAAIYAYKFTHFYEQPGEWNVAHPKNVIDKTWKLFKGPSFGKNDYEPAPNFPFEVLTLISSRGTKLNCWYSSVPDAKGTICIFHGLTSNKAYYRKEAGEFRKYGFNVLLLDFRGHGKSEGMKTSIGYNEAEDVKIAYEYIKSKGEQNIYLLGGSMGAVSVARAVAVYQLTPSGIILDMPFDGLLDHIEARGRSFGFPPKLFAYPVCFWIRIENSIPAFRFKTSSYAENISCPVLMEWGTADHLVTKEETENIFHSLSSKDKKLVIYEDALHSSFLSQDSLKWKKEIEQFLHLENR